VRLHGVVFRQLMQEYPWDTFLAGFSESHCAGHHFWRFMDPTYPRPRIRMTRRHHRTGLPGDRSRDREDARLGGRGCAVLRSLRSGHGSALPRLLESPTGPGLARLWRQQG
jgi:hypothetical protein